MHFAPLFSSRSAAIALAVALAFCAGGRAVEIPGAGALADLIMRFDANGDTKIDTGEWQTGVAGSFDEIDADRDGKIAAAEIDELGGPLEKEAGSVAGALVPKLIKPVLMGMDADKDGAVSREEFAKKVDGIFARLDANKDAVLTRAEVIEFPVKMLAPEKN